MIHAEKSFITNQAIRMFIYSTYGAISTTIRAAAAPSIIQPLSCITLTHLCVVELIRLKLVQSRTRNVLRTTCGYLIVIIVAILAEVCVLIGSVDQLMMKSTFQAVMRVGACADLA